MSKVVIATIGDELVLSEHQGARTLLIDSPTETIVSKRVSTPATSISLSRWWQRVKLAKHISAENPECAVYWVRLDDSTRLLCVSDLKLPDEASISLDHAIRDAALLQIMHTQMMCIAAQIPVDYRKVILILNGLSGVRHVCVVSGKPVFCRQLPGVNDPADFLIPLEETRQHLVNRGVLDTNHVLMCHGLANEALHALANAQPATDVLELSSVLNTTSDSQDSRHKPLGSLASSAYASLRWRAKFLHPLPAYWLSSLKRLRYLNIARQLSYAIVCLLAIMATGSIAIYEDDWRALLSAHSSIRTTLLSTNLMRQKALAHSSSPELTAQRLRRLDILRQQQAPGPDVLLATIASLFEAHSSIRLNHLSWFVVSAESDFQTQTRISARQSVYSDAESSDQLSVLISGEVLDDTLSKRQAAFTAFQDALLSINGVDNVTPLKTPVSQWQIENNDTPEDTGQAEDNFTLRFSLDAQSG